jgi:hypothetical protein
VRVRGGLALLVARRRRHRARREDEGRDRAPTRRGVCARPRRNRVLHSTGRDADGERTMSFRLRGRRTFKKFIGRLKGDAIKC